MAALSAALFVAAMAVTAPPVTTTSTRRECQSQVGEEFFYARTRHDFTKHVENLPGVAGTLAPSLSHTLSSVLSQEVDWTFCQIVKRNLTNLYSLPYRPASSAL